MRADLLLEVVDAADPSFVGQQAAVQTVLDELGAGAKPRITVYNKVDLLDADLRADAAAAGRRPRGVRERPNRRGDRRAAAANGGRAARRQMVAVDEVVPYERGELVARARTARGRDRGLHRGRDPGLAGTCRRPSPASSPPRAPRGDAQTRSDPSRAEMTTLPRGRRRTAARQDGAQADAGVEPGNRRHEHRAVAAQERADLARHEDAAGECGGGERHAYGTEARESGSWSHAAMLRRPGGGGHPTSGCAWRTDGHVVSRVRLLTRSLPQRYVM